jgi:hypothetical protein
LLAKTIAPLGKATQPNVFKQLKAVLQFWAEKEIPYAKDGYRKIGDLPT